MKYIDELNNILKKGFSEPSNISPLAKEAIKKSIGLSNKFSKNKSTTNLNLDFREINTKVLKDKKDMDVYRNLPLGVRVIG